MSDEIMKRAAPAGAAFGLLSPPERRRRFWRRQFQTEATLWQLIFDATIGMILPVLCLIFDPVVFRGGIIGRPMFDDCQLFAYGLIGIEIVALGAWLLAGARAGEWCGVLAGTMFSGTLFSVVIGFLLLPFSIVGLAFGIGILGFTPFVTAFIYWRNAQRAHGLAGTKMARAALCLTVAFGAFVPLSAPAFAHWRIKHLIERSVSEVLHGDETLAAAAVGRLGYLKWFATRDFEPLLRAYSNETDPARQRRLAHAYRQITGDDIEMRLYVLND
jgi:hypothetical protein